MANNKEYKEFFLRHTQVTSGNKVDQETNFPTQYSVGGTLKFNRFLKGDYPSENIFTKLFNSITFKKNVEDTATTTEQGLVRIATDAEAIANTDNVGATFRNVVSPSQLPSLRTSSLTGGDVNIGSPILKNGISIQPINTEVTPSVKNKKDYAISASVKNSLEINAEQIQLVNDEETPGANAVYSTDVDGTKGWGSKLSTFTEASVYFVLNRFVPRGINRDIKFLVIDELFFSNGIYYMNSKIENAGGIGFLLDTFAYNAGGNGIVTVPSDLGGTVIAATLPLETNKVYCVIIIDDANNCVGQQSFFVSNLESEKYVNVQVEF